MIPTIHGEKAVLRFLNTDTVIDSPETFGMSEENYGKVLDILKRPNGIFYITGPTGSGKTTTLYMILERLAELPVNIVAIEDPVEKHIRNDRANLERLNKVCSHCLSCSIALKQNKTYEIILYRKY